MSEFLDEGLSEKGFYRKMEKIYSEMQKYAESTSIIFNDGEVLRSTMIFFTVITSIA